MLPTGENIRPDILSLPPLEMARIGLNRLATLSNHGLGPDHWLTQNLQDTHINQPHIDIYHNLMIRAIRQTAIKPNSKAEAALMLKRALYYDLFVLGYQGIQHSLDFLRMLPAKLSRHPQIKLPIYPYLGRRQARPITIDTVQLIEFDEPNRFNGLGGPLMLPLGSDSHQQVLLTRPLYNRDKFTEAFPASVQLLADLIAGAQPIRLSGGTPVGLPAAARKFLETADYFVLHKNSALFSVGHHNLAEGRVSAFFPFSALRLLLRPGWTGPQIDAQKLTILSAIIHEADHLSVYARYLFASPVLMEILAFTRQIAWLAKFDRLPAAQHVIKEYQMMLLPFQKILAGELHLRTHYDHSTSMI